MELTRQDLNRINEYLWEIPKDYRSDMRVPARVYVSEKMLDEVFKDRTLWQLVNTTTLPGIIKYAIVMPDAHEGYGAAIGSVFAAKVENGVISPGSIGYDINCLHGKSKVMLDNGVWIYLKDLKKLKPSLLKIVDFKSYKIIGSDLVSFQERKEKKVFKITTLSGREIFATKDHPFYTDSGMTEVGKLNFKNKLIINPFTGIKFERPSDKKILNINDLEKVFNSLLKKGGNAWPQIKNYLEKLNLLPLKQNSWQLPIILKLMGYILGDGNITVGKNKEVQVRTWGLNEDLLEIKKDLEKIGVKSNIYFRKRKHKIITHYKEINFFHHEYSLGIGSNTFGLILIALGLPFGNKTKKEFRVPKLIFSLKNWQKRLFLAAFFGAELSTPLIHKNNFNFYSPTLNINKNAKAERNGIDFLKDIKKLLSHLGIKTSEIVRVPQLGINGSIGLRIQINGEINNLIRFFEEVGYEYHKEKRLLTSLAAQYLRIKRRILKMKELARSKARELYKSGRAYKYIFANLSNEYIDQQFLEHSVWEQGREKPRTSLDFMGFDEFIKNFALSNDGLVWDEIESIKELNHNKSVYDLTVDNENHNFIANNFVVSNCGVRLLKSDVRVDEIKDKLPELASQIYTNVPSGVGRGGYLKLDKTSFNGVMTDGVKFMVEKGYGEDEDLNHIESSGHLEEANPDMVSNQARSRGFDQLGTLGAGNHFVEVQKVEQIFFDQAAKALGLFKEQVCVMIHTGSRGFGHQIATDYIRKFIGAMKKYGINLPDRELAAAPFQAEEGKSYFQAMACGANFAWSNRQLITAMIRKAWEKIFGQSDGELEIVYDVAHNIGKIERHLGENEKEIEVLVHRKGATRAFGPGRPEVPEDYQSIGQPVLIPGSMGTASYVLVGTNQTMEETFGSSCHGAGRLMSRSAAKRLIRGAELKQKLEEKGIIVRAGSTAGLAEEAPEAYKDVDSVVDVVHGAGIAKKVARLVPLAVIKG